ncbi:MULTISPECIES: alpha-ketoglutarate-dependent dioxygenase AlkB [Micrococcaceae]|uniref:alpha-ketoglutarate-dependent dioxygenase AlkB n=1 Tax=unclassified Kocuria TaxID=2649579 RepID=UPI0010107099|nr:MULTISPECIES: alpha-ketoglutarate-dependent dioxygenase AlkB [unclassified Kocuria]
MAEDETGLFSDDAFQRQPREIVAGVVHVPGWLSAYQQRWIAGQWEQWGRGPIPPHSPLINGHPMSVRLTTLGWHWEAGRLTRRAREFGDAAPLPIPDWLIRLGRKAVEDAFSPLTAQSWPGLGQQELKAWADSYEPDVALINYYEPSAKMGMHQDKDERSSEPVVSVSVGDTALFRVGNPRTKSKPYQDIRLASGDLVVFGGPSRFMFHGVPKILPNTAPKGCPVETGRFNMTLRMTGWDDR